MEAFGPAVAELLLHFSPRELEPGPVEEAPAPVRLRHPDQDRGEIRHGAKSGFGAAQSVIGAAEPFLNLPFLGHVAEHQDGPEHLAVGALDGRAAVIDDPFRAVAGDEDAMVGEIDGRALA